MSLLYYGDRNDGGYSKPTLVSYSFDTVAYNSIRNDVITNETDILVNIDEIAIITQNVNVSAIFNGLEKDGSERISLWENPQTSFVQASLSAVEAGVYNNDYVINIPNNFGDFYRAFRVFIKCGTSNLYWISFDIDTRADNMTWIAPDASALARAGETDSTIFLNSTDDGGIGAFTGNTSNFLIWGSAYDKDAGASGQIIITLAGTSGYPHNIDFDVTVIGLV